MKRVASTSILATAAALLAAAVFVLGGGRDRESVVPTAVPVERPEPVPRVVREPSPVQAASPAAGRAADPAREGSAASRPLDEVREDPADGARARELVEQLAAVLDPVAFRRERWTGAASALAVEVIPAVEAELARMLEAAELSDRESVAAAELLVRARRDLRAALRLPERAILTLHGLTTTLGESAVASAAARTLVAAGSRTDIDALVQIVLVEPTSGRRSDAVWALGASTDPALVPQLLGYYLSEPSADVADAIGAVLQAMSIDGDDVSVAACATLLPTWTSLLDDERGESRHWLVYLAERIPRELAIEVWTRALDSPDLARAAARRLQVSGPDGLRRVTDRLSAATDDATRETLACTLANRWTELDPTVKSELLAILEEAAQRHARADVRGGVPGSASPVARALGQCGVDGLHILERLAAEHPEDADR